MCEFCVKHGEGEKWYLQAQNYAEDLLSDLRRRKFIHNFLKYPEKLRAEVDKLDDLNRLPAFVQAVVKPVFVNRAKKSHYGQVLPLEDVEKIFEFITSVTRLPCICRQISVGTEQRYCYALSMVPPEDSQLGKIARSTGADYLNGPHTGGLEELSKEEALIQFREMEKQGLFHSVWTFVTPFIGSICNCDHDCMAMKSTLKKSFPVMFRGEYVAEANADLCNGCRSCMRVCQFGAINYSLANERVSIDPPRCFGCGICRASCERDAITLNDRSKVPAVADIW